MRRAEFERVVREAVESLPAWVRRRIADVPVVVEDWPPAGSGLLGLYEGTPGTERDGGDPHDPQRILVFRVPILRCTRTHDEVREEVRITVLHEVGHALGLDEDRLEELGYG